MAKIALIVHACDRYQLLFKGFNYFFSKYWDFKGDINYYFATEELSTDLPTFKNIQSGKGEWSDRLRILLEKLKEPYILYFQEDMWLNKKVDSHFFEQLNLFLEKEKPLLVKLHSSEVYTTKATSQFINGLNISILDNAQSDFLMSHQVSVWDRNFLIEQLKKNEHPWRNERRGTKRLKKIDPTIYHIDLFSENGKASINKNKVDSTRSAYATVSLNAVFYDTVEPYLEVLKFDPAIQEYGNKLEYNYLNQITHDGKPKPRKVGIFKKIKMMLKGKN